MNSHASQQRLDFMPPEQPDYGNWVRHSSAEAASNRVALWLVHGGFLWLSSDEVAGKSHFVRALASDHPSLGVVTPQPRIASLKQVDQWVNTLSGNAFWAVDIPAGPVTLATGFALFHLIERARQMNRPLLISWRCPDAQLSPPELASRMRMMEQCFMLAPQDDTGIRQVLQSVAASMHWDIPDGALDVMLAYLPRDLSSLTDALQQLESASFEEQKRITKSWVKQHLNI